MVTPSASSRPPSLKGSPDVDWVKIGGIGSLLGGIAAVVTLIVATTVDEEEPPDNPTVTTGQPATQPEASSVFTEATNPADVCLDEGGNTVHCAAPTAQLLVDVAPCSTTAALNQLGVDTGLRQFDIEAAEVDAGCLLSPGARASRAGATAADILGLVAGETVSVLSLCLATDEGPEVSCAEPHSIEFVGPWQPYDGRSSVNELCDAPARRYTNRTFDSPAEPLKLVRLVGDGQYRCAIKSNQVLSESVWRLGGGQPR